MSEPSVPAPAATAGADTPGHDGKQQALYRLRRGASPGSDSPRWSSRESRTGPPGHRALHAPMNAFGTTTIIFACALGSGLAGMSLHAKLPEHHRDAGSKDVVKLIMSLIATMAALVLSLLIASGSSSYQAQENEVQSLSANVMLLDRILSFYGPDAQESRDMLRQGVAVIHDRIWSSDGARAADLDPRATRGMTDTFMGSLERLSPTTDPQRILKNRAMQVAQNLGQTRLLMFEQSGSSISWPFLTVLVFWICMLFLGFGLFARFNATVTVALFIGAISVAGAIFLILELNEPYGGFMRVSDVPLRAALVRIGGS